MRGRFISVEGLDGTGKTTVCAALASRLRASGLQVIGLREPGGTPAGEQIRGLLADPNTVLSPRAELLLFSAARAQLVDTVLEPALAAGSWAVLDRFTDSTLAYQGAGRQLGDDLTANLSDLTTGGLQPDLTLLLQAPEPIRRERLLGRGDAPDRWELADPEVLARIEARYDALLAEQPGRVHAVDASGTPEQVADLAWAQTQDLLHPAAAG